MNRLEELLKKRESLAKLMREAGMKDAFSLEALHNLILITVKESRVNQEHSEKIIAALSAMSVHLESRKDIIEHAKSIMLNQASGEVKVSNLGEISNEVIVKNLKDILFPSEISVKNFPSEVSFKKPAWFKEYPEEFDLKKSAREFLSSLFIGLAHSIKKLSQDVIIRNKEAKDAIPVRLVDQSGKAFYNAEGKGGGTFISDNKLSYGKGITAITSISVDDTETEYVLPVGKKYLSIQNKGPALVAFGPTGLNYDDYPTLTPRQFYEFIDCKDGFKVYFICDSGKTSTIVGFTR